MQTSSHNSLSSISYIMFPYTMPLQLMITLAIILAYLLHRSRRRRVPRGPLGLPVIGNLHQFLSAENLPKSLWKLSQKYGPIMQLKLGSIPVIIVSSAKSAKEVLKTQDLGFCSRPRILGQQKLSYNGLDIAFTPYSDYWREIRKITATHLFSLRKTQTFRPVREDEVSRMVAKIESSGGVVDLSEMAMTLGSRLICRIAFGKRYGEHDPEIRRFEKLLREAQALMASFFVSDYLPRLGWVDRLTGLMSRLDRAFENLDSFYQELIDEHLDPNRSKEKEKDILDVLIQLKEEKSCSIQLSWDHIKALLMNIFIAATETSAATIVWTMTALMKEAKVMEKLHKEIRNLVGQKGRVEEYDLPNLPYLKAVINETLRFYPPTPLLLPRETIQKCTLEGYEILPKTVVYVNAWAVAKNPEYWENPDEFVLERFMNSNIDVKGRDFGVIPFGSGRRMCPGMSMGLVNVQLTVANLVYSFDWEMPPGIEEQDIDVGVLPGVTAHKKIPPLLVPKKYNY